MKKQLRLIAVFMGMFTFFIVNAQIDTVQISSGTDVATNRMLRKSTISVDGNYAYRTFVVEVAETGEYFLSAWLLGAQSKTGDYVPYEVMVNGVKLITKINPTRSNWQSVELKNEKGINIPVKLISGHNKIAFVSKLPDVADVEFVKVDKEPMKIKLDDSKYFSFINELKIRMEQNKNIQKKDSIPPSHTSPLRVFQLPNPEGNYEHRMDVSFAYTTYKTYSFSAGQQVFITTYAPSGYEHVLELFSSNNPQSYSWTGMSNSANMASLNINIPATDTYYVRIRSYRQGSSGVVTLNVNGQYYFNDCPVTGNGFSYYHTPSEVLNYFTCHNTTDPRIWIESTNGFPGTIVAYNDDYGYQGGDWSWGLNSRIKKQIGTSVSAVLISAYGSYNPTGTCDFYMGCKNSNITSWFPNLKADDAIQSAPASGVYNCTAWAGGITSFWYWGSTPTHYYGDPSYWTSWDNYFGNNPMRYAGAQTFTPDGANADNAVVAMWALNGSITHGSVRGYANAHPHGYDWESKPGSLMRTFHPRDALNGSSYGSIVKYYRNASGNIYARAKQNSLSTGQYAPQTPQKVYTFDESVKDGLTVIENVTLDDNEKSVVKGRNTSGIIDRLYSNWATEIKSEKYGYVSNPYILTGCESGKQLLNYGKNNISEAVLLFADVIFDESESEDKIFEQNIAYYMFCEMAQNKYGEVMEQIKKEWRNNNYNEKGSYIAPLPETFTKKYLKRLLNLDKKEIISKPADNAELVSVSPNPATEFSTVNINLSETSVVSIRIVNSNGLIQVLLQGKALEAGYHSFNLNYSALPLGISICTVEINGKVYTRKLLKK